MYKIWIVIFSFVVQSAFYQYIEDPEPNFFRMWVQPQIGMAGSGLSGAMEVDAAYHAIMVGFRGEGNANFCVFCTKVDRTQQNFLVGVSKEIEASGSISFLSGMSHFTGHKKGAYVGNQEILDWSDGYEQLSYEGIGLPFQLNLVIGKNGVGFGTTGFIDINSENPTGGFFIGLPFGKLKS